MAVRFIYEAIELSKTCSCSSGLNLRPEFGAVFPEMAGGKRKVREVSWKLLPRKLLLNSIFGHIKNMGHQFSRKKDSLEFSPKFCGVSCLSIS